MHINIASFYKLVAVKCLTDKAGNVVFDINGQPIETGETRELTNWFPNKLLNNGRNRMGEYSDWLNCCQVGVDNTNPTNDDTALLGWFNGTSTIEETQSGAQTSAPYYGWKRRRYRFSVGTTAANLSEVGVGWGTTATSNLVSRALIVDIDGNQTTVTPKADEILDVWFEMRYYPPLADVTGQVTFNGELYNYTVRAARVTLDNWGDLIGQRIGIWAPSTPGTNWRAADGNIGTILQAPNGNYANGTDAPTNQNYSLNSYQTIMHLGVASAGFNLTGGFRSIHILTTAGEYQTEFSRVSDGEKVQKTVDSTMNLGWVISWSELAKFPLGTVAGTYNITGADANLTQI